MKKVPLDRRIEAFRRFGGRFDRIAPLIFCRKIPQPQFFALQEAVGLFIGGGVTKLDHDRWWMPNVTPNGMIVPKRNKILEYNLVVRRFAEIINGFSIGHLIESWHVPLNVRVKYGEADPENLKRDHPTEDPHSDSWAGESAESVTVHIPLFGDTEKNYVEMYHPPEEFEESWLGPRPTYADGAREIAVRYAKVDFITPKGALTLMDFATLHASTRAPGAGTRVSIDTTFVLKKQDADKEVIHPWRKEERMSHAALSGIGETHLMVFPDSPEEKVDSRGGFKHPTNMVVKRIDGRGLEPDPHVVDTLRPGEEP